MGIRSSIGKNAVFTGGIAVAPVAAAMLFGGHGRVTAISLNRWISPPDDTDVDERSVFANLNIYAP